MKKHNHNYNIRTFENDAEIKKYIFIILKVNIIVLIVCDCYRLMGARNQWIRYIFIVRMWIWKWMWMWKLAEIRRMWQIW